jgi:uncharacterized protein
MPTRICTRCRTPYETPDALLPNAAQSYAPFCSKRCADVDLVHWLKGDYVIDGSGGLTHEEDEDGGEAIASSTPNYDAED